MEALAFEVFDLELDEAAWAEMVRDPSGFVRELIESEGIRVAGNWVDDILTTAPPDSPPDIQVYHCVAPPEHVSKNISIVIGPTPH